MGRVRKYVRYVGESFDRSTLEKLEDSVEKELILWPYVEVIAEGQVDQDRAECVCVRAKVLLWELLEVEKHLLLNEGRQALDLSHEDPLLDFKWLDVFLLHFGLSLLSRFCLGGLSDRILLVLDRTQVGLLIDVLVQRFLAQPRQRMRQRNRTYWNSVASLSAGWPDFG